MTIDKITIKQIGEAFANTGYIQSDSGIMQYNDNLKCFDYVSDNEVLDIFRRAYPNFERRVLKVAMIEPYLPYISDKDFAVYDQVKNKLNYKPLFTYARLSELIQEALIENENRKQPVADIIPIDDFNACTQYLINNDIFTDGKLLYRYKNDEFNFFGIYEVQHLFKDVTMNTPNLDETAKIMYMCRIELTDITGFYHEYKALKDKETITDEDKKVYSRIQNLIEAYKEYLEQ